MTNEVIGLLWDSFTDAVQGQITRDIIALQQECDKLSVVCPDGPADRLVAGLNVERVDSPATLWITYQTGPDPVYAPESATTVIDRDLYVKETEMRLDPTPQPGYFLKPQGRIVAPTMNLKKLMPNHFGPVDPLIVMLWS